MLDEHSTAGIAAVIGAGTMGGGIAAQLANAGWQVKLLDVPSDGQADRNQAAEAGLHRLQSARPPLLFLPEFAERIETGNTADNLDWLGEADWVVEAVAERMDVKQAVLAQIEAHCGPETVVSSNTSGLSLQEMVRPRSRGFQSRFLGSHFLNPPRYLKLLEVVPLPETDAAFAARFVRFAEQVLGHRVVIAKDTPGFISTRIWIHHLVTSLRTALDQGLSIEEADYLTGAFLGRPRSGTFRMADIVGLDIVAAIAANQHAALQSDPHRDDLRLPETVESLIEAGRLGDKTSAGFYMREGKAILALDPTTGRYRPRGDVHIPEAESLLKLPLPERLPRLAGDRQTKAGRFVNTILDSLNRYAEYAGPLVASDTLSVDNVMRWGFQWELGPFEIEDLRTGQSHSFRGAGRSRQIRVFAPGEEPIGYTSINSEPQDTPGISEPAPSPPYPLTPSPAHPAISSPSHAFAAIPQRPEYLTLAECKAAAQMVFETTDGALIDIGDRVACLEFRTKMNTFSPGLCETVNRGLEIAVREFSAMVIGTDGPHFSAGYNLKLLLDAANAEDWDAIDTMLREVQSTFLALKYAAIPVVAAVRGYALGAGCECALHCAAIQAGPELAMGLPELSAGLVPAGGGVKELLALAMADWDGKTDASPRVERAFRQIALNPVSGSAAETRKFGLLRPADAISRNADRLLFDAKKRALTLAQAGFEPPAEQTIQVLGPTAYQRLIVEIEAQQEACVFTEHDSYIARLAAAILACGTAAEKNVSEQRLCDLERSTLIQLAHHPKSIARMKALLDTGKPLKN